MHGFITLSDATSYDKDVYAKFHQHIPRRLRRIGRKKERKVQEIKSNNFIGINSKNGIVTIHTQRDRYLINLSPKRKEQLFPGLQTKQTNSCCRFRLLISSATHWNHPSCFKPKVD